MSKPTNNIEDEIEAIKREAQPSQEYLDSLKLLGLGEEEFPKLQDGQIKDLVYEIQKHTEMLSDVLKPKSSKVDKKDDNFKAVSGSQIGGDDKPQEYDTYLVWEPETSGQKLKAAASTQAELIYCMFIIMLSLYLSSGIAIFFMLTSFVLLHTSMYPQKQRWRYARNFVFFYLFLIICISSFKWVKIDTMQTETRVWKNYQKEIKFYELLGFKIIANDRHAPKEQRKKLDADPNFYYRISAVISQSFFMEMGLLVFTLTFFYFLGKQQKKINYLTDPDNQEDIKAFAKILEKDATHASGGHDDEEEVGKPSTGTRTQKNRAQIEAENLIKEQAKEREEKLRKTVLMNYVDCDYFYRYNSIYFMTSLAFVLFQGMINNSCIDIPSLFLIQGLFASYPYRKMYTKTVLEYIFTVMYYLQFIIIIKIVQEIVVKIEFIEDLQADYPDHFLTNLNNLLFGSVDDRPAVDLNGDGKYRNASLLAAGYLVQLLVCFWTIQCWKLTKWIEIRNWTSEMQGQSYFKRFGAYISGRGQDNALQMKLAQQLDKLDSDDEELKNIDKLKTGRMSGKKSQASIKKKAKNDMSKHLPTIVMTLARLEMFTIIYIYHCPLNLVHLFWLLMTFLLSDDNVFLLSMYSMLPVLMYEFLFIYAVRIPVVKDTTFIKGLGGYMQWTMRNRMSEQVFFYITLATFIMMPYCLNALHSIKKHENALLNFFKLRIKNPKYYNTLWIAQFNFLRYIQLTLLCFLFYNGMKNLNSVQNLAYMGFFVIYTAYEEIYRQTSKILVIFVAAIIFAQYFFSIYWHLFYKDDQFMDNARWLNLFPQENPNSNPWMTAGIKSMYYRVAPNMTDWCVLILMKLLHIVNQMFKDKKEVMNLQEYCSNQIKDNYGKAHYYWLRTQRFIMGAVIYLILIIMVGLQYYIEQNLLNWIFWILNVVNFALMIRGSKQVKYLKQSLCITNFVKVYALLVLIADILFIVSLGELEKPVNYVNSWDVILRNKYPELWKNLDIIGFRSQNPLLHRAQDSFTPAELKSGIIEKQKLESQQAMESRFVTYVAFFLFTCYLAIHFKRQIKVMKTDQGWSEEDYQRLFEFKMQKPKIGEDTSAGISLYAGGVTEEDLDSAIFKKKHSYHFQDLIDYYEKTRFTLPFMIYRAMGWWPTIDILATYGHGLSNGIIVYIAINYSVSFFMAFNIISISLFYYLLTSKLNQGALKILYRSGLQTQCDVKMAQLITKRYKNQAFYEFIDLRRKFWNVQFTILIVCLCVCFPTTLIELYKQRQTDKDTIAFLTDASFWTFITGIYMDTRDGYAKFMAMQFGGMIIGLVIERQSINWLKNRFGCTYFKLQKFIELDQRREGLRYNWEINAPAYNLENYRKHYFLNDFDNIKQSIEKNQNENKDQLDDFGRKPIGDFVPVKIAKRMQKCIEFSVQSECRAPDLDIDDVSREMLSKNQIDDYEDVPLYMKYKVGRLQQNIRENVDFKYKISLYKGIQLFLESAVQFLLMFSIVMKANVYSLIYLIFIFRYIRCRTRTELLVKVNTYMSIIFIVQYVLYLINLTALTSPAPFPPGFFAYPINAEKEGMYAIPVVFHYKEFYNLRYCYLLGFGVDKDQVNNLNLDFLNLFIVSMYVMIYRNPILLKKMNKVFWQFPTPQQRDQWQRLDPNVQKQVKWLFNYKPYTETNFQGTTIDKKQEQTAEENYDFALEYNQQSKISLNYMLINYVDMKYDQIWSNDYLKKKKQEIKENSPYYRVVKQGSQLVYISFHIFTIFIVLLMATMRQSIISLGYVLILLPRMKDGSEVLDQRNINQNQSQHKLEEEIEEIDKSLNELQKDESSPQDSINELKEQKKEKIAQISKMKKKQTTNFKQKQAEKKSKGQQKWAMIWYIQYALMTYAVVDFTIQIIGQLPIFEVHGALKVYGFRKIWSFDKEKQTYADVYNYEKMIQHYANNEKTGLRVQMMNFFLQLLNCLIISIITLQCEIFISAGYIKYVSQSEGSMDLLCSLADLKAKSITYVFNNFKIRKIVSIQKRRETIDATVQKLREKIIRWRKFTKTTLLDPKAVQASLKDWEQDEFKLKLKQWAKEQGIVTKDDEDLAASRRQIENDDDIDLDDEEVSDALILNKKKKSVRFPDEQAKEEEEEEEEDIAKDVSAQISQEDSQMIQSKLVTEFVKVKLGKIRYLAKFYIWLNQYFTEQIMFKNNKEELEKIVQGHAEGQVAVPTELEKIMTIESEDLIKARYDHSEGKRELAQLLIKSDGKSGKGLLELTDFESSIKLKNLDKSWAFTRTGPLMLRLLETFFYIIISNTQNFIYGAMIFSMYQNAGIVSIFYPISVFGFALLEETRPHSQYWNTVRTYTTFLLFFKFIANLSILEPYIDSASFKMTTTYLKVGLYDYSNMWHIIMYMSPEILIICMIMLNEIKLKLIGLYHNIEQDIETVNQGIERTRFNGDEEAIKNSKIMTSNMGMSRFFESLRDQLKMKKEYEQDQYDEIKHELQSEAVRDIDAFNLQYGTTDLDQVAKEEYENSLLPTDPTQKEAHLAKSEQQILYETQMRELKSISNSIFKASRKFDVDANMDDSPLDQMVEDNILKKGLESDNLVVVEGCRREFQPEFLTSEEFDDVKDEFENWEAFSAGDLEIEIDVKTEFLSHRGQPKLGMFEKSKYFNSMFPSLKIQKPGYDLYGSSTISLALLTIYVVTCYQHITVDPKMFKFMAGQTNIFNGEMTLMVLFFLTVIILERYTSRTDTKAVVEPKFQKKAAGDAGGFFSQEEMFKRASTARSMTVQIKTMKTADLDMQGGDAQEFLSKMYGGDDGEDASDMSRTKITTQQKTKYILHMFILIFSHVLIFWYLPIIGNITLYGDPQCNEEKYKYYGCRNFHRNIYLRVYYILFLVYLFISAAQLRKGFPIVKKPSSVMQYYGILPNAGAQAFVGIPFLVEIRCVLDFTMSKTSLDIFQYLQLWNYHAELYIAKNGNEYYGTKKQGLTIDIIEKCTFGVTVSFALLFLLIGPFVLFSEYGGLTQPNPVLNADFELSFHIEKEEFAFLNTGRPDSSINLRDPAIVKSIKDQIHSDKDAGKAPKYFTLKSTHTYPFFSNRHAFLKTYDDAMWKRSEMSSWTETNAFEADQVQDCIVNEFTDEKWLISQDNQQTLWRDIQDAVNLPDNQYPMVNVTLQLDYAFTRQFPATASVARRQERRQLDYTSDYDCLTGIQLKDLSILSCKDPYQKDSNGQTILNKNGNPLLKQQKINFQQALLPHFILGQNPNAVPIDREGIRNENQRHDLEVIFECGEAGSSGSWTLLASTEATVIPEVDLETHEVNPETCKFTNPKLQPEDIKMEKTWGQLTFVLFSVLVSSSFLASMSPIVFYTSITLIVGQLMRPILIFGTWKGFIYEVTDPMAIIKLVEKCYLARHEENFVEEEEAYRMLQEIVRSPELLKALCGSCLKGPCSPELDKMSPEDVEKLDRLRKLEAKGFDVALLQQNLIKGKNNNFDDSD